jgi:hypothetical protein
MANVSNRITIIDVKGLTLINSSDVTEDQYWGNFITEEDTTQLDAARVGLE